VCVVYGSGQGAAYGGYGQPMSSAQPAAELMEPSQQLTQSTYQGAAAANVGVGGGATGGTGGQPQAAGYIGQQAAQQQQQTFNPNSRFVNCLPSYVQNTFRCFILCSGSLSYRSFITDCVSMGG